MLRILSDLHFHDAESRVRQLEQLVPLLTGVDHLVLNGDTCETERGLTAAMLQHVTSFFQDRVPRVTFVTGNHDPAISETHELLLADGRVWVTHGDVLFADATPWSTLRDELERRIGLALATLPQSEWPSVETRLRVNRAACVGLPREFDHEATGLASRLNRLRVTLFPPHKVLAMLRAWRDTPRLAAELAAAQRTSAQVVVTGHIHNPGVWRRPCGRVVVNTGAFGPPRGALAVDLVGDHLAVRRVTERAGRFHPGKVIAEIPLVAAGRVQLGSLHA